MRPYFKTLLIVYTGLFLCLNLLHCSSLGKVIPEYRGVNPKVAPFVKEFKEIAQMQGITFKHEVTIGFKNLRGTGTTIGLTTYGANFHEIDLDEPYWNNSTEITKKALLFHELTHAYCNRRHDWDGGTKYPEFETWQKGKEPKEGHYSDGSGCALSIMYPIILDDFCMLLHYSDYMVEMWSRCEPY